MEKSFDLTGTWNHTADCKAKLFIQNIISFGMDNKDSRYCEEKKL